MLPSSSDEGKLGFEPSSKSYAEGSVPPRSFKIDSSFFEKIAIGAVGARAVVSNLAQRGHDLRELENGSTDTRIWRDVKRKRVRIPDLVCVRCGLRIESRAKSQVPRLAMSHSVADAERAWDFGLVQDDVIAFPVCTRVTEKRWTAGALEDSASYWHSRDRVVWTVVGSINYFPVRGFRDTLPTKSSTKGATEGSETSIEWPAIFSTREGVVARLENSRITVRRLGDGHSYTWPNPGNLPVVVEEGDQIEKHAVLASAVPPISAGRLSCTGVLPDGHIDHLLVSKERTQRFTGVKLARLRVDSTHLETAETLWEDSEEDLYVRLEAAVYLCSVGGKPVREVIGLLQARPDPQIALECVVALAEVRTLDAVSMLADILHDSDGPEFLRSAAAWALGRIGTPEASDHLIASFDDLDAAIREEALLALAYLAHPPFDRLVEAAMAADDNVAAGAAEVLRRHHDRIPETELRKLVARVSENSEVPWPVWLLGNLAPYRDDLHASLAELQATNPKAHYAIAVLWSFMQSWIATTWEPFPRPIMHEGG